MAIEYPPMSLWNRLGINTANRVAHESFKLLFVNHLKCIEELLTNISDP